MRQLVILSGKGGTGKTSLAAAFAHLAQDSSAPLKTVLADADVDAANLELVLRPIRQETHDFTGGSAAVIDLERCQGCDLPRLDPEEMINHIVKFSAAGIRGYANGGRK